MDSSKDFIRLGGRCARGEGPLGVPQGQIVFTPDIPYSCKIQADIDITRRRGVCLGKDLVGRQVQLLFRVGRREPQSGSVVGGIFLVHGGKGGQLGDFARRAVRCPSCLLLCSPDSL